ncbi:hypothetical protein K501DRAFT_302765 [Backusella circina FSU 941]|nr:hypothetical protein K501DRAFT_302765 [Backusella circina FSU 941]
MADPLGHCLERLYLLDDPKIKPRAEQFNGKLSKLPAKVFDRGPNCKIVICIQLAHESLKKQGWDNKLAAQLAGCTAKSYESVLSVVRQSLDIQPTVTFDHLAVALGSSTMLKHIHALWDTFTTKYIDELKGVKKMNARKELELPCWKGAVVFVCAKALGVKKRRYFLFIWRHTLTGLLFSGTSEQG